MLVYEKLESFGLKSYRNISKDKNKIIKVPNFLKIPVNNLEVTDSGARRFNEIYQYLLSCNLKDIVRTPSGGIKKDILNCRSVWDIKSTYTMIEITIGLYGRWFRIQFRTVKKSKSNDDQKIVYGRQAFLEFKSRCIKDNINLDDYKLDEQEALEFYDSHKNEMTYYKNIVDNKCVNKTINNVHHIDLCSGFQSGLVRAYPEFKNVCQELYDNRKTDSRIKSIQTNSIGYMWSPFIKRKYIKLSYGAISENNRLLFDLSKRLTISGRRVLLYNTDGIWYQGEIFHDIDECHNLGGWRNDHTNCTLRVRSAVSYEFIEDGKYTAIQSGLTQLDRIKPRSQWTWGDIYKTGDIIEYKFMRDRGIVDNEGELY